MVLKPVKVFQLDDAAAVGDAGMNPRPAAKGVSSPAPVAGALAAAAVPATGAGAKADAGAADPMHSVSRGISDLGLSDLNTAGTSGAFGSIELDHHDAPAAAASASRFRVPDADSTVLAPPRSMRLSENGYDRNPDAATPPAAFVPVQDPAGSPRLAALQHVEPEPSHLYRVAIKTGDAPDAASNAPVSLAFLDATGRRTREYQLQHEAEDFGRDATTEFRIGMGRDGVSDIAAIDIGFAPGAPEGPPLYLLSCLLFCWPGGVAP